MVRSAENSPDQEDLFHQGHPTINQVTSPIQKKTGRINMITSAWPSHCRFLKVALASCSSPWPPPTPRWCCRTRQRAFCPGSSIHYVQPLRRAFLFRDNYVLIREVSGCHPYGRHTCSVT